MTNISQHRLLAPSFIFTDTDGTPIVINDALAVLAAATANQQVVAAVTGKKIRVLSILLESGLGTTAYFKSGSGGGGLFYFNAAAGANEFYSAPEIGLCETAAGVGLFCDTGTNGATVSLRYITFTQAT